MKTVRIDADDLLYLMSEKRRYRELSDRFRDELKEEFRKRTELQAELGQIKEELNFIDTFQQMYDLHGCDSWGEFQRRIYRDTACGAWVERLEYDEDGHGIRRPVEGIKIGSIVEGTNECPESITIMLPTTQWHWGEAIKEIERAVEDICTRMDQDMQISQLETGEECPLCKNGTVAFENNQLVCRGECGCVLADRKKDLDCGHNNWSKATGDCLTCGSAGPVVQETFESKVGLYWPSIVADMNGQPWERMEEDREERSVCIGTVMGLTPSGKYYQPWACSNVEICGSCARAGDVPCDEEGPCIDSSGGPLDGEGHCEACRDAAWYAQLEAEAADYDYYVSSGEGCATDIFLCESRDVEEDDVEA